MLILTLQAVSLTSLAMLNSVFSLRVRLFVAISIVASEIAARIIATLVF